MLGPSSLKIGSQLTANLEASCHQCIAMQPDRDDFIRVNEENIVPEMMSQLVHCMNTITSVITEMLSALAVNSMQKEKDFKAF